MLTARNDGAIPLVSYMRRNLTAVWLQWPLFILFFFLLDPSNLLIHTENSRGKQRENAASA